MHSQLYNSFHRLVLSAVCVQLDCLQGSTWKAICLTSLPGKLYFPCLKASIAIFCPLNPCVCASFLSSFLFLLCVNVWAHRTRETVEEQNWDWCLRIQQQLFYVLSVSGEGTQDFVTNNNVLTFLLALPRWILCSDNGWDSPEKSSLLLPKRSVCYECLFSFLFMSVGQVPWESQQFQKFMLFILTCNHFDKAQNRKHQQLQMCGMTKIPSGSPSDMFTLIS